MLVIVVMLGVSLAASSSRAQLAISTTCSSYQTDAAGNRVKMQSGYVGLTNHIVGCVRETLDSATSQFFDSNTGFYPLVKKAIAGTTTLAVIVFGIMAAFGMLEKVGRDSIMLLIKIAAVSTFAMNTDYLYHQTITMMDSVAQSVVSFVPENGTADNTQGSDFSKINCLKNMNDVKSSATSAKYISGPWLAMDCILDTVIGIKVENLGGISQTALGQGKAYNEKLKNADQGLSRGMLYFFFSAYSSSVMGFVLAIIGLIFIWGIISLIIKALFIYIAGYLGIAVLMMAGPLFIPMLLFQATKAYFDKWLKLVISFALQPVIILVFVVLSISAVDLATFSGDYSVMYRIAGEASRQSDFSLNYYLTCDRDKSNPSSCLCPQPQTPCQAAQNMNPDDIVRLVGEVPFDLGQIKGDTKDPTPTDGTVAGDAISGLENSKCTKALMSTDDSKLSKDDQDLKQQCAQSYPLRIWKTSINWKLVADVRNPAVVIDTSVPAGDQAQDKAEQVSKEAMAAVIFAAVVVFVMNGLLKVIPMVAYDLVGDFGQMPNLGAVAGGTPGHQGIRSKMESMVTGRKSP